MRFDIDDSGTAILVSVAALLALITFTSSNPSAGEILFVVGFSVLALRETGTIAFGSDNAAAASSEPTPEAATDGGQELET